jgi:hypothetical protein
MPEVQAMNEDVQLVIRNDECLWVAFDELTPDELDQAAWRNDAFSQYLDGMKYVVTALGIDDGIWDEEE